MEDYGAQPGGIHPDDAAGWMALWLRQQRSATAARLPRRVAGPGTARGRPGRACTSGRRLFRPRRRRGLRVVGPTG
eukprot:10340112-Lingulodinium_polyedra.AAC.1